MEQFEKKMLNPTKDSFARVLGLQLCRWYETDRFNKKRLTKEDKDYVAFLVAMHQYRHDYSPVIYDRMINELPF
jgi:hypothetical protein